MTGRNLKNSPWGEPSRPPQLGSTPLLDCSAFPLNSRLGRDILGTLEKANRRGERLSQVSQTVARVEDFCTKAKKTKHNSLAGVTTQEKIQVLSIYLKVADSEGFVFIGLTLSRRFWKAVIATGTSVELQKLCRLCQLHTPVQTSSLKLTNWCTHGPALWTNLRNFSSMYENSKMQKKNAKTASQCFFTIQPKWIKNNKPAPFVLILFIRLILAHNAVCCIWLIWRIVLPPKLPTTISSAVWKWEILFSFRLHCQEYVSSSPTLG